MLLWLQVREDLRGVCLEALTEKTSEGQTAVQLRKEAERLMERSEKVRGPLLCSHDSPPGFWSVSHQQNTCDHVPGIQASLTLHLLQLHRL